MFEVVHFYAPYHAGPGDPYLCPRCRTVPIDRRFEGEGIIVTCGAVHGAQRYYPDSVNTRIDAAREARAGHATPAPEDEVRHDPPFETVILAYVGDSKLCPCCRAPFKVACFSEDSGGYEYVGEKGGPSHDACFVALPSAESVERPRTGSNPCVSVFREPDGNPRSGRPRKLVTRHGLEP